MGLRGCFSFLGGHNLVNPTKIHALRNQGLSYFLL